MQDHAAWLAGGMNGVEEDLKETYKFFMRPDPKQRKLVGPIQTEWDELTQRKMRFREARIGMVRNAKDEDLRPTKVYLDPLPHVRIKDAKQLQGWYQAKGTPENATHRPRPCYTDAMLTEPYGGFCSVGCSFSCRKGELIDGPSGGRPIEGILVGDYVLGRFHDGVRASRVVATTKHWKEEGYAEITFQDGKKINVTEDHPVYSLDRGWIGAGRLEQGEAVENLRDLRGTNSLFSESLRRLSARSETQGGESLRESYAGEELRQSASWKTEVRGDAQTYERARARAQRGDGRQSALPEVSKMEVNDGGDVPRWANGLYAVKARPVQRREHALQLGAGVCCVDGFEETPVDLRTMRTSRPEGRYLSPRLLGAQVEDIRRGQRLDGRKSSGEDEALTEVVSNSAFDEGRSFGSGRSVVKSVVVVRGGLWVYDIETTSENFFVDGILVHNCYINSGMRGYRGTGLATVPVNYGEQVADMISKLKTSAAGYFSSFIDPFLPLEDYYHNTEKGALAFVQAGLPIFFLSRIKYPNWAVELLQANKYSYAQKSINTPDPKIWSKLSPGALPLNDHLRDIRRLKKAGIYVSIQCNPILPGIVNHKDVVRLFERLADAGTDHVIVKFVEAGYSWAETMVQRTVQRFGPEMGGRFKELFTQNIGGQRTIQEEYRMEGHHIYAQAAKRVGLTYATCYEYKYARDEAGEIINKVGVSVGADFLTADQCHGHRVPMFTRSNLTDPFREVKECPSSGCLTCGDGQPAGLGPCGSELFSAAKALKMADFKHGIYEAGVGGSVRVSVDPSTLVQIKLGGRR